MNGKVLYVQLATNIGQFKGQMAAAGTSVVAFGAQADASMARLSKWATTNEKELRSLGSTAGKFGLASAFALGISAKAAIDWEQAWTGVTKTVDGTDAQMASLEGNLRNLTTLLPSTHEEIAAVAQAAGQLGVGVDDITEFTRVMVNLGNSTNLTAEEAATEFAIFNNVMGLSNARVEQLGSSVVALGNNFPTTEAEILSMSSRLSAAGRIAGLSAADITGFSAALTSVGVEAEAGGTAMSKVFMSMRDAAIDGGAELDTFAKTAGVSAQEFSQAFQSDPAKAIDMFVQGLARMAAEGKSTSSVFDDLGLADQRLMRAVLSLGQAGDVTSRAIAQSNDAYAENAALANEAGKFNETSAARIKRSWNGIKDDMIDFGEEALPILDAFLAVVDQIGDIVGGVPGPVKQAAVASLALAAALGVTVWAGSRAIGAVGQTRANVALLKKEAASAAVSLQTMNKSMLLKNAAKGAAVMAGFAVMSTEMGQSLEVSNTIALGLMGTMAGPFGVAIGAGVGSILDIRAASKKADAELQRFLDTANDTTSMKKHAEGLDLLRLTYEEMSNMDTGGILDDEVEKIADQIQAMEKYEGALQRLEDQTTGARDGVNELFDPRQMQRFVEFAEPALEKVGVSLEDALNAGEHTAEWSVARQAIRDWIAEADTAAGRADVLGGAVAGLDDDMSLTADAAGSLSDSLNGLFSPAMDYDAAVIAWKESLRDLKDELGDGTQTLDRNTEAGQANRKAVMDSVDALQRQLVAAAEAGKGSEQIARMMKRGREAILDQAEAVGFNRKELVKLIDKYGLTPELVQTLIEQKGAAAAGQAIDGVTEKAKNLGNQSPTPSIEVLHARAAVESLQSIINKLNILDGKSVRASAFVDTYNRDYGQQVKNARGNYFSGSGGDLTDRHVANMYRAGAPRTFAEPETQGEAYIPFAMDRRGRSTKLLGAVAQRFGYDLSPRGAESASRGVVMVNSGAQAPMIGSLSLTAGTVADTREGLRQVNYEVRRLSRGGRWK